MLRAPEVPWIPKPTESLPGALTKELSTELWSSGFPGIFSFYLLPLGGGGGVGWVGVPSLIVFKAL